ncbi:hypothetical protein F5890DRAFT_1519530 [Lentinula detonsa]|uniref:Uncharacterized protein n=1 Tax=Lentinula detonsa TaxID=2804962 RepID=A0AA38USE8_9AGAR|nr:hypothetical protein F5890DRAFT_1519530 [Lentinula detonsa]
MWQALHSTLPLNLLIPQLETAPQLETIPQLDTTIMDPCAISSSFKADRPELLERQKSKDLLSSELEPSPRTSNALQPIHLPIASPMSNERNAAIDAHYDAVTHYICIVGFSGTEKVSMDPVDAWQASCVSLKTTLDLCTLAVEVAESTLDESQEEVLIHSKAMVSVNTAWWLHLIPRNFIFRIQKQKLGIGGSLKPSLKTGSCHVGEPTWVVHSMATAFNRISY